MSRQARGRALTVTSAAALTRTTSISGNSGVCSAIRIVATCGTPAFRLFTNILRTKPAANCGTDTPICRQVSEQRQPRSEEHTSELQSRRDLVCRLLLEKKKERSSVVS